jgi:hypothetical protein
MTNPLAEFPLPTFTLMLKDESGPYFLGVGGEFLMPFFTSQRKFSEYKTTEGLDCVAICIGSASHVCQYITQHTSNAPRQATDKFIDFKIVIDPISARDPSYCIVDREAFLAELQSRPKRKLRLMYPVYALMTDESKPLLLPDKSGEIWPILSSRENAVAFAHGIKRSDAAVGVCNSALELMTLIASIPTDSGPMIWANEEIVDAHAIHFKIRLSVGEFMEGLEWQAGKEGASGLN